MPNKQGWRKSDCYYQSIGWFVGRGKRYLFAVRMGISLTLCCLHYTFFIVSFLEINIFEPLAQLVEQQPFKLWVVGSNPTRLTIFFF